MAIACALNAGCCGTAHLRTRADRDVLPPNVKPASYDLTITPNMEAFTFEGHVVIDLEVKEATRLIALNVNELAIKEVSVTCNG
jgi:aminopeptidase 2